MAAATKNRLPWIVEQDEEIVGKLRYPEDAAYVVANCGDGATIRYGRKVVWTEGAEEFNAADSYDGVAELALKRLDVPSRRTRTIDVDEADVDA